MKRFVFGAVAIGLLLMGGQAAQAARTASTDNFTITKYEARLELGRDAEHRSRLMVVERITADFPPRQNHGLSKEFVRKYNGHPTDLRVTSITDETGKQLEHHWEGDTLRIGNKNTYVKGVKTYVITYQQRDVTRRYADTAKDEFYWNVIGQQWRVPIQRAAISVSIDPALVGQIQTDMQCYMGYYGSKQRCRVEREGGEFQVVISDGLPVAHGVTMAIGFAPGTFAEYQASLKERLIAAWQMAQKVMAFLTAPVALLLWWVQRRLVGRRHEIGTIVAEYIPPRQRSVTAVAQLPFWGRTMRGSTNVAQLLDLAVRHYVALKEVRPKTFWRSAEYEIEITKSITQLQPEEKELLIDMFDGTPRVGRRLNFKSLKNDYQYAHRLQDNDKKVRQLLEEYGLIAPRAKHRRALRWLMVVCGVAALVTVSPIGAGWVIAAFVLSRRPAVTDEGLVLKRYVEGLKLYIGAAEEERLNMLQSPEGAEKVGAIDSDAARIKLYERLLPYAVLFGQEKQWTQELGRYYEKVGAQPEWYTGNGAFNAAVFAAGMGSLSSAAGSTFDSSSSSGGSGGDGFSGGGGGGGGGGGW